MTDPVFFTPSRRFTVGEIAAITGASLIDPLHSDIEILSIAASDHGEAGLLIYVDSKKHVRGIDATRASAVLCRHDTSDRVPAGVAVLISEHPQRAFATIARLIFPSSVFPASMTGETAVSPMANIAPDASVEAGAIIEAGAVICPGAAIGAGSVIAPGAVIGMNCTVGRGCYIGANASIGFAMIGDRVHIHAGVRIGEDGFGYVAGPRGLEKIPQIGRVIIQDDVEIGSNTTIDRGAMGDTIIGEGTKIDNLVQIAHNVQIGRCCVIAGQCGVSGSVRIGDYAALGGSVGVADHLEIGAGAMIAAGSGIMHNVPAGEKWFGSPAQPHRQRLRELVTLRELSGAGKRRGKANG